MLSRLLPLISLLILSIALFLGFFVAPSNIEGGFILCWFKRLTTLDCPGCGLTRAFLSIPRGHFIQAFHYNWASLPLYFSFFLYWIHSLKILITGQGMVFDQKRVYALSTLIMLLLVLGWVFKLVHHFVLG